MPPPSPIPLYAALVGATAAMLFAFFKSFLDRRQSLNDIVDLLRSELENAERHARDSLACLPTSAHAQVCPVDLDMCAFPGAGLVSLAIKDLLGLPPTLAQDLMTLVIYLRNLNLVVDRAETNVMGTALPSAVEQVRQRLAKSAEWASAIRAAMKARPVRGGVKYSVNRKLVTIGDTVR